MRANAGELGALVGINRDAGHVDPIVLDTAAVLAAHVAASLDAAFALRRERLSAATDPLTGILNRRGLEERMERALSEAQEQRVPLSMLVIDCDDFKEINDRAGHEFGDALLREVADVLLRALPEGADAARLGGDEFVVMLPAAGADAAEALGGQIRTRLAEGLTDAGFPLRISAGVSTYPFDGATPTSLLRAGDQALYAAKTSGKDRIASFRELAVAAPGARAADAPGALDGRRRGRNDGSGAVLADAMTAATAIEAEGTVEGVCTRLCKALVFVVGATACSASRVVGDFIVDASEHALREVSLGDEAAYRIADFPLTADVLASGEPRSVSFADGDVDPAEAFILRDLGMNALLMLPIRVSGRSWGLVELYEMRLRRFGEDDIAVAQFLVAQAERRLETVADLRRGNAATAGLRAAAGPREAASRPAYEVGAAPRVAGQRGSPDPRDDVLRPLDVEDVSARERSCVDLDEPVALAGDEDELDERLVRWSDGRELRGPLLELGELGLTRGDCTLTPFDRGALELDRAELLSPPSEVRLGVGERGLALGEARQERRELRLARLEVGGSESQHALDRSTRVAEQLLAPFELGDRFAQPLGMRVELVSALRDELLELLLGARARGQDPAHQPSAACLFVVVLVGARHRPLILTPRSAGGSILSRRVRSDPPA